MSEKDHVPVWPLARLLLRSWQYRASFVLTLTTCVLASGAAIAADQLQLSPNQVANSALGNYDVVLQLPGSAPLGTPTSSLDGALLQGIESSGGKHGSIDFIASGLTPDGEPSKEVIFEEIGNIALHQSRLSLATGDWPSRPGEVVLSKRLAAGWAEGETITFFGGQMRLLIVGTYEDRFQQDSLSLIAASGTWSSLQALDGEVAAALDEAASRKIRWMGADSATSVAQNLEQLLAADPEWRSLLDQVGGVLGFETRSDIESVVGSRDLSLQLGLILGPGIAALLGGLIAGTFLKKSRDLMWTIGIDPRGTFVSGVLALVVACTVGAGVGAAIGLGLGYLLGPLIDVISPQDLGPIVSQADLLLSIPVAGLLGTIGVIASNSRRFNEHSRQPAVAVLRRDLLLLHVTAAVFAVAFAVFISGGTSDVAIIVLSSVIVATAIAVLAARYVPLWLSPIRADSLAVRLSLRQFSSQPRASSIIVSATAILQVIAITLTLLLSSTFQAVNNSTESSVAPNQLVIQLVPGESERTSSTREKLEKGLGLGEPVTTVDVAAGSDRGSGPTRTISAIRDLEALIARSLTEVEATTLASGGILLTEPITGPVVTFPGEETYSDVQFSVLYINNIHPSFRNLDGFMLERFAVDAGLPLSEIQTLIYTRVPDETIDGAKQFAIENGINPDFVQVFREPDVLSAPLRIAFVALFLGILASVVMMISARAQVLSLRPTLIGLHSLGIRHGFLRRVIVYRLMLTFGVATVLSSIGSLVGVTVALWSAGVDLAVSVPVIEYGLILLVAASAVLLAGLAASSKLQVTERDWIS